LDASVGVEAVLHAASELAMAMAVSEKKVRRFMKVSSIEMRPIGLSRTGDCRSRLVQSRRTDNSR
jgi:hypothetical protein